MVGFHLCQINYYADGDPSTMHFDQNSVFNVFCLGRGNITFVGPLTLASSISFNSTPPTFTLQCNTTGGPPTMYNWTRDGAIITTGDQYSTSFAVNGNDTMAYYNSSYRSSLTVIGNLPGVYQYSVTNRASATLKSSSITIESMLCRYPMSITMYALSFY